MLLCTHLSCLVVAARYRCLMSGRKTLQILSNREKKKIKKGCPRQLSLSCHVSIVVVTASPSSSFSSCLRHHRCRVVALSLSRRCRCCVIVIRRCCVVITSRCAGVMVSTQVSVSTTVKYRVSSQCMALICYQRVIAAGN
jgi:hypothetical protein